MGNIITGVFIAFLISFYAIPIIIQLADQAKLYDIPDARKVHKKPIPSLGGLGIFTHRKHPYSFESIAVLLCIFFSGILLWYKG